MDTSVTTKPPLIQPSKTQQPPASSDMPLVAIPETSPKKGSGSFMKFIVGMVIGAILTGGGYYLGMNTTKSTIQMVSTTPTPEIIPADTSTPDNASDEMPMATISGEVMNITGTKIFTKYSITIAQGWTNQHDVDSKADIDKLTLTKNGYILTINQAPFSAGGCIYKGDPPEAENQLFTNFADIKGQSAQFRRSWNDDPKSTITYSVCERNDADKTYSAITTFGQIDVQSPKPADEKTLSEIDSMIASLKK